MRKSSSFWCVLVCLLAGGAEMLVSASEDALCQPIGAIYANGQELCENMWDGAFVYETNEDAAYTMWFFDETSPNENDAITAALGNGPADTCDLQYLHKQGAPTAEGTDFTECHPWKENACCYEATVTTHDALNEAYGEEYEWDRCGKLSQACERFFVQEACFYECEVNAGLYRAYTDEQWNLCDPYSYDPTVGGVGAVVTLSTAPNTATPLGYAAGGTDYYGRGPIVDNGDGTWTYTCSGAENKWKMAGMPIKASYCDAWYNACFEDNFCASGGGSYFSCAKAFPPPSPPVSPPPEALVVEEDVDKLPRWAIGVIVVGGFLLLGACACICLMYSKEKKGQPLFVTLPADGAKPTQSAI